MATMPETSPFAKLLVQHCRRRGVSATALSKRAGLGVNTVRHLQRGLRRPQPATVMAVARALELDAPATAELRRSAGVDPDPATEPEARRARLDAWPALTYTLVNHVLLPRLQLASTLETRASKSPTVAAALKAAADSPDLIHYCDLPDAAGPRPRGLTPLLERTFSHLGADRARRLHGVARSQSQLAGVFEHCGKDADRRDRDRFVVVNAIVGLRRPNTSEYRAWMVVQVGRFHPVFAVSMFPLIYLEACRTWPFEKVFMPYAYSGEPAQRELYNMVRGGIALEDLDAILIGRRRLGVPVRPARQRCHLGDSAVYFMPDGGSCSHEGGGPSQLDTVFDHLDRCEFLDRFPLIKLDQEGAADLARAHSLPSWKLWRDELRREPGSIPAEILDEQRFPYAVDANPPGRGRPDSFVARIIGDALQAKADELVEFDRWKQLSDAVRALGMCDEVAGLVASYARRPTDRLDGG